MSNPNPFDLILNVKDDGFNENAKKNRQALFDAYRAMIDGKSNALFDLLDDNVAFHEAPSLPYGGTLYGRSGAQSGVAGMFGAWSYLRVEIEEFLAAGDLVIAYMHLTNTSRATGKIYVGPVAEVFRFQNGKITEWRPIYWDTHAAREACGVR
jgi:uncharacterized protein